MFLHIMHANGQTSEIPVGPAHTLNVRDATGAVVASVSFSGVTDFSISYASLYADEVPAVELALEEETGGIKFSDGSSLTAGEVTALLVDPVAATEPAPVTKPRKPRKK